MSQIFKRVKKEDASEVQEVVFKKPFAPNVKHMTTQTPASSSSASDKIGNWVTVLRFTEDHDGAPGIDVVAGKPKLSEKALLFHVWADNGTKRYDLRLRRVELDFLMERLMSGERLISRTRVVKRDPKRTIMTSRIRIKGQEEMGTAISLCVERDGNPHEWIFTVIMSEPVIVSLLASYRKLIEVLTFDPDFFFNDDVCAAMAKAWIELMELTWEEARFTPELEEKLRAIWALLGLSVVLDGFEGRFKGLLALSDKELSAGLEPGLISAAKAMISSVCFNINQF